MVTKAHILQEIKRTAEENDGKPLGVRKFGSETGIRQCDWDKHWARWRDAISEAGFVPNELTGAYEDTELLDKQAQLAKELGRLPTSADLRFKACNDPEFPHDRPFRRFGAKSQLVKRLLEYCETQEGYEDVVCMCRKYSARTSETSDESTHQDEQRGFVYLIKSGRFYKIGRSNCAGRREYELAIQLPEKAKTVHVIRTDDPSGIEEYWHKRFAAKRKNGEWFELNATDVAAFKRRKFM